MADDKKRLKLGSTMRVIPMDEAARELERTHKAHEDAHEVVVGALRGLIECADQGDEDAVAILRALDKACAGAAGDDAMRDALSLFFDTLKAWNDASAVARAAISRQEG